jgi:hypothetical protein
VRKSEVWRFAKSFRKLVALPVLIAVLLVELLAWRTGATLTYSVRQVAELQHEDPDLVCACLSAWTLGQIKT